MNNCSSNYEHNDQSRDEYLFRQRVRKFLTFNFVLFVLMIFGIGLNFLWKISVLWGAFLAFKAWRIYDKDRDQDWPERPNREQYGRPRKPGWKKNDLV